MDWEAHLRMMQESRRLRYELAQEVASRAGRLRTAFANKNWEEFEKIKAEVANNEGTEETDSGTDSGESVAEEKV